jgi:hypothetical protein
MLLRVCPWFMLCVARYATLPEPIFLLSQNVTVLYMRDPVSLLGLVLTGISMCRVDSSESFKIDQTYLEDSGARI